jgi:hypothetical protein
VENRAETREGHEGEQRRDYTDPSEARYRILTKLDQLDEGQIEILHRQEKVDVRVAAIERDQAVIRAAVGFVRWVIPLIVALLGALAGYGFGKAQLP